MWELNHKEGRASKNWCFWIVLLEKTLESPLHCKVIKPVNPKGNQPWVFIGRSWSSNWPPGVKTWYIGKDPNAGKDWRQKDKGWQRMRWLDSITDSMDINFIKFPEITEDRGAWHVAVHGVTKSQTWLHHSTTKKEKKV